MKAKHCKRWLLSLTIGWGALMSATTSASIGQLTGVVVDVTLLAPPSADITGYVSGAAVATAWITFADGTFTTMAIDSDLKKAMFMGALSHLTTGQPVTVVGTEAPGCGDPANLYEPTRMLFD